MTKTATYSLAPQYLYQPITLFTVNMGSSSNPEVEREVQALVGTSGRQIGHIQDALEVLLRHVPMSKLSRAEKETLNVLKRDISSVRQIKKKHQG